MEKSFTCPDEYARVAGVDSLMVDIFCSLTHNSDKILETFSEVISRDQSASVNNLESS